MFSKQCPSLGIPLICIGNAVAGGAGKTPTTLAIAALLKEQGYRVHIVTKGYGGRIKEATQVSVTFHTSRDVGDEAFLMATHGWPVWVGKHRYPLAKRAQDAGADVVLFDDGLQDWCMPYDIRILVVDAHYGFGNGHLLPMGPLRESIPHVLQRVDALCVLHEHSEAHEKQPLPFAKGYSGGWIHTSRQITLPPALKKGDAVVAFAGIGNPEQFQQGILNAGLDLRGFYIFPDHHFYSEKEITILQEAATQQRCPLLTTEKDFVRLSLLPKTMLNQILFLPLTIPMQGENLDKLVEILSPVITSPRRGRGDPEISKNPKEGLDGHAH